MISIFVIAQNTFKELIRDRILYGIIIFAFLLFILSLLLGQLSYAEQARIVTDFGFTAIQISAAVLAVFIGGTLVRREVEKKTIFTLLARPLNRTQFLLGKLVGLYSVVVASVGLLALALTGILISMSVFPDLSFLLAIYGVLLESAVLLAMTILFGSFSTPFLSSSLVTCLYLVGHSVGTLKYFMHSGSSEVFSILGQGIVAIVPNLEMFNWKSYFLYKEAIQFLDILSATAYALAWSVFLFTISAIIFNRKDLG